MLKTGTIAPDFDGQLDDGQRFRLSTVVTEKNVVLYFYPKDFTSGCTREACTFQENYAEIERFDAVIVGVSGDSSESHRSFREQYKLGFPLVADPEKRIIKAYGAETLFGLTARVTFVINKSGIIRSVIRHDLAIGKHLSDVLKALSQIESESVAS